MSSKTYTITQSSQGLNKDHCFSLPTFTNLQPTQNTSFECGNIIINYTQKVK